VIPAARGPDAAVALFAKAPVPGRVKTRLTPPLSPEEAAAVARASLEDTLRRFPPRIAAPWTLFLDGGSDPALAAMARGAGVRVQPQGAGNLGDRLARAFARLHGEGARRVVAVGSDSPTLDPARIGEALDSLHAKEVVLGPTDDGGYYLIGTVASVDAENLFRGVPWSTPRVARFTEERAASLGLRLTRLPEWYDLDDATSLRRAARDGLEGCPSLAAALFMVREKLAARSPA
jgi:hypothetical protein